jgi:hypothetical protein
MVAQTIKNMFMEKIRDELKQKLITDIAEDDYPLSLVKIGKLQDNPTKEGGMNLLIWSDDNDEGQDDKLYTSQHGIFAPVYEIGGSHHNILSVYLTFLFHFRGLRGDDGRDESRMRADLQLARAKHALYNMGMPLHPTTLRPTDDFGETAIQLQVMRWHVRESGGTGHFIWKGKMTVELLTNFSMEY